MSKDYTDRRNIQSLFRSESCEPLGSTDVRLSPAVTDYISEQLGINFRRLWDLDEFVIGSVQITEDGDDDSSLENCIFLEATRHWDPNQPGLEILMSWWTARKRPTADFIERYRQLVTATLSTLPPPVLADSGRS